MRKSLVIVGLVVVFIICGIALVLVKGINTDNESKLVEDAINISDVIISFYQGENSIDELRSTNEDNIDDKVYSLLEEYNQNLKLKNNEKFNISDYYNKTFNSYDRNEYLSEYKSGASDDGDLEDYSPDSYEEQYTENDERIFTEGDHDYILVSDLDFSSPEGDIILYNGNYFNLTKEEVPETYDMMISNPENYYKYSHHAVNSGKRDNYIDVSYVSVTNQDKRIMVRVHHNNKVITHFEVRK